MARTSGVSVYVDNKAEDIPRFISLTMKVEQTALACVLHPAQARGAMLFMTGRETVLWEADTMSDCPGILNRKVSWEEASSRVTAIGKPVGEFVEPRLKGQWTAKVFRANDNLILQLQRKPNNYTQITITSNPTERMWEWKAERLQRYFSGTAYAAGGAAFLKDAIESAVAQTIPLANEVCGVKDTLRRQPMDPQYAVLHPSKPAKTPKIEPVSNYQLPTEKPEKPKTERKPKARAEANATEQPPARGRKKADSTAQPASQTNTNTPRAGRGRKPASPPTIAPAPAPQATPPGLNAYPTATPAPVLTPVPPPPPAPAGGWLNAAPRPANASGLSLVPPPTAVQPAAPAHQPSQTLLQMPPQMPPQLPPQLPPQTPSPVPQVNANPQAVAVDPTMAALQNLSPEQLDRITNTLLNKLDSKLDVMFSKPQ